MSAGGALRKLIEGGRLVMAPGAPEALTARLIEQAGFPAIYMTGFGATAVLLGCPDIGLLTQTEMTTHARDMARAVAVPVIADADTGYGGPANIERTVKEYGQAGVAAIHLEDQVAPKRCGHMAGVKLVPAEEMARRLDSALAARGDSDLLIIGRTDALAAGRNQDQHGAHEGKGTESHGGEGASGSLSSVSSPCAPCLRGERSALDEAIQRACRFREVGADLVFVDAIRRIDDARAVGQAVGGPLVISLVEGSETAGLMPDDLKRMGFAIALYPLSALFSAAHAVRDVLAELKRSGTAQARTDRMLTYAEFSQVVDLTRFRGLDDRFGTGAK